MNNLHLNYHEFHGRLYVSNEETKDQNLNTLTPEESKKASINNYGKVGQWGIGRVMEFFGYAEKVKGGDNTYYLNKKSYNQWLERVNTLNNSDELTCENLKNVSLKSVKDCLSKGSQGKKEITTPRIIEKDLSHLFEEKMKAEMLRKLEEDEKDLSRYKTMIADFKEKILEPKRHNILKPTYRATLDRIDSSGKIYGLKDQLNEKATSKDKLLALKEYEEQRFKSVSEIERDYFAYRKGMINEDQDKLVMRYAIILSDPEILRIIDNLPREENWDTNVSQIYKDYKLAVLNIKKGKWIE